MSQEVRTGVVFFYASYTKNLQSALQKTQTKTFVSIYDPSIVKPAYPH